MTKEEKQLLLVDLCARLPYLPIVEISIYRDDNRRSDIELDPHVTENIWELIDKYHAIPYLRPMSSMTEEEKMEYNDIVKNTIDFYNCPKSEEICFLVTLIDWLNAHYFDYRGLIEKGLALEAPKRMYNIN